MSEPFASIDRALIRGLAELLRETDLNEIEVSHGELHIRLSRSGSPCGYPETLPAPSPIGFQHAASRSGAEAVPLPSPVGQTSGDPAAAPEGQCRSAGTVPSPMVGTAYLAPAPGDPPFVKVGSTVQTGDKLMIIEAMKVMNFITTPQSGTVTAILIENGQLVEYGEPLMVIE